MTTPNEAHQRALLEITRRHFLEAGATGLGAAALASLLGCTPPRTNRDPLAGLTNLWLLDISAVTATNLSSLTTLTRLTELSVGTLGLSDLSFLAPLTNLVRFRANDNFITDLPNLRRTFFVAPAGTEKSALASWNLRFFPLTFTAFAVASDSDPAHGPLASEEGQASFSFTTPRPLGLKLLPWITMPAAWSGGASFQSSSPWLPSLAGK